MGNEPAIAPGTTSDSCTDFASHMGRSTRTTSCRRPSASTNIITSLALSQASSCASMRGALGVSHRVRTSVATSLPSRTRASRITTCKTLGAWATCGSAGGVRPERLRGRCDSASARALIALTSGLIDGAKGVVRSKLPAGCRRAASMRSTPCVRRSTPRRTTTASPSRRRCRRLRTNTRQIARFTPPSVDLYLDLLRSRRLRRTYGRMIDWRCVAQPTRGEA